MGTSRTGNRSVVVSNVSYSPSDSGVSSTSAVSLRRTRRTNASRVSPGSRASSVQHPVCDLTRGEQVGGHVRRRQVTPGRPLLLGAARGGLRTLHHGHLGGQVVIARVKTAESIPPESILHELVCLGVHLPRHPADAEALEQSDETARNFVQLTEMCLSHRGDTIYLVHHELRVHVDPDSLDPVIARKLQSLDQRLVLRHVVGGRTDRLRDLIHGDQTARSQERTNRRAAQWVPGAAPPVDAAPISVEKVVPALQAGPRLSHRRSSYAATWSSLQPRTREVIAHPSDHTRELESRQRLRLAPLCALSLS